MIDFLRLWDHQEPILKITTFIENNLIKLLNSKGTTIYKLFAHSFAYVGIW